MLLDLQVICMFDSVKNRHFFWDLQQSRVVKMMKFNSEMSSANSYGVSSSQGDTKKVSQRLSRSCARKGAD